MLPQKKTKTHFFSLGSNKKQIKMKNVHLILQKKKNNWDAAGLGLGILGPLYFFIACF